MCLGNMGRIDSCAELGKADCATCSYTDSIGHKIKHHVMISAHIVIGRTFDSIDISLMKASSCDN